MPDDRGEEALDALFGLRLQPADLANQVDQLRADFLTWSRCQLEPAAEVLARQRDRLVGDHRQLRGRKEQFQFLGGGEIREE